MDVSLSSHSYRSVLGIRTFDEITDVIRCVTWKMHYFGFQLADTEFLIVAYELIKCAAQLMPRHAVSLSEHTLDLANSFSDAERRVEPLVSL